MSEEYVESLDETIEETQEQTTEQITEEQPSQSSNDEKKEKLVSNVSVKQCIATIIFSIVVCALSLIPYTFGSMGFNFTFKYLPLIGNGEIMQTSNIITDGLVTLFGLSTDIINILALGLNYFIVIFFGIAIFDILAATLLAIFRNNIIRIIFKIISIIAGVAMILIALLSMVYILGLIGGIASGTIQLENMVSVLESSGILFILVMMIFACFMAIKQFRWFGRRW